MDRKTVQKTVLDLLQTKPVAFNPALARLTGSIKAGLLLSQLLYWSDKVENDWFYKTIEEIREETSLSRTEQESAIRILKKLNLIEVEVRGVPARRFFKVSLQEIYKLVCRFSANQSEQNQQTITEITAETTSENETFSKEKADEPPLKNNIGSLVKERYKHLIRNKPVTTVQTKDTRLTHSYQHYGLEVSAKLNLNQKQKKRVMGFMKKTGNGFALSQKLGDLVKNQQFLQLTQKDQVSYLIGAYRKNL